MWPALGASHRFIIPVTLVGGFNYVTASGPGQHVSHQIGPISDRGQTVEMQLAKIRGRSWGYRGISKKPHALRGPGKRA